MIRERALKVVLVLIGLLFSAGVLGLIGQSTPCEQMLGIVYATLGVFLLLAVRNPSAHRSLIAFTAWSSLVHAALMAEQALRNVIPRRDLLVAVLPMVLIGAILLVLAPAKTKTKAAHS